MTSEKRELIIIPPASEILPDEFNNVNQNTLIHIFYQSEKASDHELFKEALKENDYEVPNKCIHILESVNLDAKLREIREECMENPTISGLILFFSGVYETEGNIISLKNENIFEYKVQDIWSKFTTYNIPNLKDKPKIFIFQISKQSAKVTYKDSAVKSVKYDMPGEADIGIIYNVLKVYNTEPDDFVQEFCNNIKKYGKIEDIFTLATISNQFNEEEDCLDKTSPCVLISTLTKKFYFRFNEIRGYNYLISKNIDDIIKTLEDIKLKVDKPKKKVTRISSFIQKINSWGNGNTNKTSYFNPTKPNKIEDSIQPEPSTSSTTKGHLDSKKPPKKPVTKPNKPSNSLKQPKASNRRRNSSGSGSQSQINKSK